MPGNKMTLLLGDGMEWLAEQPEDSIGVVITDPPYSKRTHKGQPDKLSTHDGANRRGLDYEAVAPGFLANCWSQACRVSRGWVAFMTSHDLVPALEDATPKDRLVFPPLPIISKKPRIQGDGPSPWASFMLVCRPRNMEFLKWGTLPGLYEGPPVKNGPITGCKDLKMMRAIVRDYSRRGDLIADPFAGWGTTLLAASIEGRPSIGVEINGHTFEETNKRLARPSDSTLDFGGWDENDHRGL